jgi:hypothetical protein
MILLVLLVVQTIVLETRASIATATVTTDMTSSVLSSASQQQQRQQRGRRAALSPELWAKNGQSSSQQRKIITPNRETFNDIGVAALNTAGKSTEGPKNLPYWQQANVGFSISS